MTMPLWKLLSWTAAQDQQLLASGTKWLEGALPCTSTEKVPRCPIHKQVLMNFLCKNVVRHASCWLQTHTHVHAQYLYSVCMYACVRGVCMIVYRHARAGIYCDVHATYEQAYSTILFFSYPNHLLVKGFRVFTHVCTLQFVTFEMSSYFSLSTGCVLPWPSVYSYLLR